MSRIAFWAVGGCLIAASYAAVILVLPDNPSFGPVTIASILLPALISGLVITTLMALEARRSREANEQVSQLNAQLIRKEIEIDRLSTVDELTGLYTRRQFDESLRAEFERGRRHRRPLALLLVELDDLQELGEDVGKLSKGYLLSEMGAIMRSALRLNDVGCRYNNDNLAVLLPETNTAQALVVAEKVRALVGAHRFLGQRGDNAVSLTVSQGIAVAPAAHLTAHLEFLRTAEEALATARIAGYNQVHVSSAAPEAIEPQPAPDVEGESDERLAG